MIVESRKIRIVLLILFFTFVGSGAFSCASQSKRPPAELEAAAFDELRAEIELVIQDPQRSAKATNLVAILQNDFALVRDSRMAARKRLDKISADYDATKSDFAAFFAQIDTENRANQKRLAKTYGELIRLTTAEEWGRLAKSQNTAMNAAITSLRSAY